MNSMCGTSHLGQGRSALGLLSSLDLCRHLAVKVDLDQGLDLVPVLDHGVWRVQSGDGGVCDCASSCLRWLSRRCRILVRSSRALLQAASIPSPGAGVLIEGELRGGGRSFVVGGV